jgi:hypothetical protein
MLDPIELALFVALGVAFAAGLAILSRWASQNPVRLAAYALIAVSCVYVGFALGSAAPNTWFAIEMTGLALFGSAALLSLLSSPWFVVAGLLLHPIWAIVFHYNGTGSAFTPAPFALADAGFDVALGLYVGFMAWRGARKTLADATPAPAKNSRKGQKGAAR